MGGSELGSYEDLINVSRTLAPGGSFSRVLRDSEALGYPRSKEAVEPGDPLKKDLTCVGDLSWDHMRI